MHSKDKLWLPKRPLDELCREIQEQLDNPGPYSHNIIALILTEIDKRFGREEVNKAITELGLEDYGWSRRD